jgi:hypothetical protein
MNWRGWIAVAASMFLSACSHVSDQAIVDNCRAGGGLTVTMCECVRSEMKGALDAYSYDAMVLLANGRDEEAGGRLGGLTERDQVTVAATMMSAYTMCVTSAGEAAR